MDTSQHSGARLTFLWLNLRNMSFSGGPKGYLSFESLSVSRSLDTKSCYKLSERDPSHTSEGFEGTSESLAESLEASVGSYRNQSNQLERSPKSKMQQIQGK